MQRSVKPSAIKGSITAPSSKSMTQRAIAAALLAEGHSIIRNPSYCNDSLAALGIAKKLGADVEKHTHEILIKGSNDLKDNHLNCGESGLGVRMFTPIASIHPAEIHISGEGSLLKRPVDMIEDALQQLGVTCKTNNGLLPLHITGPLTGGDAHIDGSVSSQLLTGLLMALPRAKEDSTIHVDQLKSKPYIDMTIQILNDFGVSIENHNYEYFTIPGNQDYEPRDYTVEGDWSGGAFLLVAGAINGEIKVKGLRSDSKQSDVAIMQALKDAGAMIQIENNAITISKAQLRAFTFDATECPDLFPPLVTLAAYCEGVTEITGVERLQHKESDRAMALQSEFGKMGIRVELDNNIMKVYGGPIGEASVDSHNDHRIAMAAAIAAISATGTITISHSNCVAKSYPDFFKDLKSIGGIVHE